MKEKIQHYLIRLLPFTLLLFILQYLAVNFLLNDARFYYSTYAIYLFHFTATLLIYVLLVWVYNNFKDNTGFAFMGAGLLKMLASIIFLLPVLLNNTGNAFEDLLAFFIPYFLFLVFETIYAVKLINTN